MRTRNLPSADVAHYSYVPGNHQKPNAEHGSMRTDDGSPLGSHGQLGAATLTTSRSVITPPAASTPPTGGSRGETGCERASSAAASAYTSAPRRGYTRRALSS